MSNHSNSHFFQISTGCHHSALLTKDGTVYTWGRNLDGQIGNGTRREVLIPTPLSYDPATTMANTPSASRKTSEQSGDITFIDDHSDQEPNKMGLNCLVKAVKICCGSDFTIAIQPGN